MGFFNIEKYTCFHYFKIFVSISIVGSSFEMGETFTKYSYLHGAIYFGKTIIENISLHGLFTKHYMNMTESYCFSHTSRVNLEINHCYSYYFTHLLRYTCSHDHNATPLSKMQCLNSK